jgi:hypothetical protein
MEWTDVIVTAIGNFFAGVQSSTQVVLTAIPNFFSWLRSSTEIVLYATPNIGWVIGGVVGFVVLVGSFIWIDEDKEER